MSLWYWTVAHLDLVGNCKRQSAVITTAAATAAACHQAQISLSPCDWLIFTLKSIINERDSQAVDHTLMVTLVKPYCY